MRLKQQFLIKSAGAGRGVVGVEAGDPKKKEGKQIATQGTRKRHLIPSLENNPTDSIAPAGANRFWYGSRWLAPIG